MRLAALLLPLLLVMGGCQPDRSKWIAANEALLTRLPHYPGSTRVGTQNLAVEAGNDLTAHVVGCLWFLDTLFSLLPGGWWPRLPCGRL